MKEKGNYLSVADMTMFYINCELIEYTVIS